MYRFTRIYFSIEQAVYAHVYLCVLVCVCVDVYVLFIKMCLHYTFTHVYAYIYRFAHTCMGISVFPHTSAAVGMRGFRTYSTHFVYPATSTFLNNSVTEWEQSFFERVSCTWKVRNVMSCVCVCVCVWARECVSHFSLSFPQIRNSMKLSNFMPCFRQYGYMYFHFPYICSYECIRF